MRRLIEAISGKLNDLETKIEESPRSLSNQKRITQNKTSTPNSSPPQRSNQTTTTAATTSSSSNNSAMLPAAMDPIAKVQNWRLKSESCHQLHEEEEEDEEDQNEKVEPKKK